MLTSLLRWCLLYVVIHARVSTSHSVNSHWTSRCMADLFCWFVLCSKRGRKEESLTVLFWSNCGQLYMPKSLFCNYKPTYLVTDIWQTSLTGTFGIHYQCLNVPWLGESFQQSLLFGKPGTYQANFIKSSVFFFIQGLVKWKKNPIMRCNLSPFTTLSCTDYIFLWIRVCSIS